MAFKSSAPECSMKYSPGSGGTMGDTFESEGAPGDKGMGGESAVTGNKEEGEYNHDKMRGFGPYPHSPADPDWEGPALASSPGPNGDVDMGSHAATMPNDRIKSGY